MYNEPHIHSSFTNFINAHIKAKANTAEGTVQKKKVKILGLLPWFIVVFIAVAIVNSLGFIISALVVIVAIVVEYFIGLV